MGEDFWKPSSAFPPKRLTDTTVEDEAEGPGPGMSDDPRIDAEEATVPIDRALDGILGFEVVSMMEDYASGRVPVTDRVRQRWGLVHGGVYAGLSEMLAAEATNIGVYFEGMIGLGMANHTTFLKPIAEGNVNAEARRRHRGSHTWLWDVEITDDERRMCGLSRVTIAVRHRKY